MISPFYCKYTICKSTKLDGYHNTADLISFLNQIPQLTPTIQHHFANSPEFPHFISLTLLSTNYQSNSSYEGSSSEKHSYDYSEEELNASDDLNSGNHQTNLIVVLVARANNAPRYVEPILEKISQYLNWELMHEQQKEETENDVLRDLFHSDDYDFENDNDDDQEDNDEDEDDFDIHITKNIPGYAPFHRIHRTDSGNFPNNNRNNPDNNNEEDENKDDDQEDDNPNNDLSRFK